MNNDAEEEAIASIFWYWCKILVLFTLQTIFYTWNTKLLCTNTW